MLRASSTPVHGKPGAAARCGIWDLGPTVHQLKGIGAQTLPLG